MEEQTQEQPKKTIWQKLKSFFAKDIGTEEQVVVRQEEQPTAPLPEIKYEECFWCKTPIYVGEKFSNQQSRNFHRKCYKKFLQAGYRGKIC